jgi:hypothetical protein
MRRITPSVLVGLLILDAAFATNASAKPPPIEPVVKVIPTDEPAIPAQYRRALVGPGFNEPEAYPGYTGFIGWAGLARTRTGVLLMTFLSGYWHASPPSPLGHSD